MPPFPIYVIIVFAATVLFTLWWLFKSSNTSVVLLAICLAWLALQGAVALSGFYTRTAVLPPRFGLLVLPPVVLIIILFLTKQGKGFIDGMNAGTLTLLHAVRIPVELTLYWLFVYKTVPQIMTFEGHNFDILCGLTAPLIYYFGYVKKKLSRQFLIGWNIICLLLLFNIVITAVLAAPFPIQKFGFEQPNIALLYFPYIWLPCFIVPAVLLAHLACLRKLIVNKAA